MIRLMLATVLLVILVSPQLFGEENNGTGIERLKELKFEIRNPEKESSIVGGVEYGPKYRWCVIAPGRYMAQTEPGMLRYLLEDKSINSLSLYPGPQSVTDLPDEYIDLGDNVLEDLPVLTHLEQLRIGRIDFSTNERVDYLRPLDKLSRLRLRRCKFSLLDLKKLGPSTTLISVWIEDFRDVRNKPRLSKQDVTELARQFPNLENIYYKSLETFDQDVIESFGEFKHLRYLRIDSAKLQEIDFAASHLDAYAKVIAPLKEELPKLEVLVDFLSINWKQLEMEAPIVGDD